MTTTSTAIVPLFRFCLRLEETKLGLSRSAASSSSGTDVYAPFCVANILRASVLTPGEPGLQYSICMSDQRRSFTPSEFCADHRACRGPVRSDGHDRWPRLLQIGRQHNHAYVRCGYINGLCVLPCLSHCGCQKSASRDGLQQLMGRHQDLQPNARPPLDVGTQLPSLPETKVLRAVR